MSVIVDGKGFVHSVRELREFLKALPSGISLLMSERKAHAVSAHGYEVFGVNAFGDMIALSCSVSDSGENRERALCFLNEVVSSVGECGVIGWLFRMLWQADDSLGEVGRCVLDGRVPLPGEESVSDITDYMDAVCRMGAWVLLRWSFKHEVTCAWANLLLQGRYPEVLDGMLPYAAISFDEQSFEQYVVTVKSMLVSKGIPVDNHTGADSYDDIKDSDAIEEGSALDAEWSARLPTKTDRANSRLSRASRQYIFDSEHVESSCRLLIGATADKGADGDDPWLDKSFTDMKARGIMGEWFSSLLMQSVNDRDERAMHEALKVLADCRDCVRMHGILSLPVMLVAMGQDMSVRRGGRRDDESSPAILKMNAAAAVVALSWIADTETSRDMGLALLRGDISEYASLADRMQNEHKGRD